MLKYAIALLALGFLFSGCAPRVAVVPLDSVQRPPRQEDLTVYPSPEQVGRAFQQIARLSIDDKRSLRRDEAEDLALLAEAAKALGAEAVVILKKSSVVRKTKDPSGGGEIVYAYPHIEAAAIVFQP